MRWILSAVVMLAGCGSSWQPRKDEALEVGCLEKLYYPDMDEDGWGDGTAEPITSCSPIAADYKTVPNGRDCDDGDRMITGRVGGVCPADLLPGRQADYEGVVYDDTEMVYIVGEHTPGVSYAAALAACEEWGVTIDDAQERVPQATLATLRAPSELERLKTSILGSLESDSLGVFGAFIGLAWDGEFDTATGTFSGQWAWVDGSTSYDLIDDINWCNGPLTPADLFPRLNPLCDGTSPEQCGPCEEDLENPSAAHDCGNHQLTFIEELDRVRLALVYRGTGEDWCVGLPRDAMPADLRQDQDMGVVQPGTEDELALYAHLGHTEGHFICKRPMPNADDYTEYIANLQE